MFLKNAWYVAAWDHEVTRTPLAQTLLGERVVLYRTEAGLPVALEDACPHRKLPLSMGRVKGDHLECGYHGLTFDGRGQCVRVPGATRIPPAARVRSYPVVSRYGLVWIWMGDAALADPRTIFEVEHDGESGWSRNSGGSMLVHCNYLYITDNLLDPSHVAWVHPSSFGTAAAEEAPIRVTSNEQGVISSRWMTNTDIAPFYAPLLPMTGPTDRLQHYEVRYPSHALIRAVFAPIGSGGDDRPLAPESAVMDSYNFMTPVDADHTRYYWFQIRNFAVGDSTISETMNNGVRAAFAEDKVVLEAVHQGLARKTSPNIDLAIDRAPLTFRKKLAELIAREQQHPSTVSSVSSP